MLDQVLIEGAEPIEAYAVAPPEASGVAGVAPRFTHLNLDLEVFQGPFDLLLELVMREEVDLLEVDLAAIVLAYVDLLAARGDMELEPVTEFVVLIAALLELKSRLMLPQEEEDVDLGFELGAEEAADELLARMLEYHRYNRLAEWMHARLAGENAFRYRSAPLPAALRRVSLENVGQVYQPNVLGEAIARLLTEPEPLETPHMLVPRVTLDQRLKFVRTLLLRSSQFDFDTALGEADRLTECLTIFALLELYKMGEATWQQAESFGPIAVMATGTRS